MLILQLQLPLSQLPLTELRCQVVSQHAMVHRVLHDRCHLDLSLQRHLNLPLQRRMTPCQPSTVHRRRVIL
jgi:hypothetical protein